MAGAVVSECLAGSRGRTRARAQSGPAAHRETGTEDPAEECGYDRPGHERAALEPGGNAEHAVRATIAGRFLHQGQICRSTNRIIVDAKVYDEFVGDFSALAQDLKSGDPNDPGTSIGPIINKKQLAAHMAHIQGARAAGARQVVGGDPTGHVLPPHVFVDVKNDMQIAQDEMFGPIAPIIKVNGEAEALRVANDTQYGLSSAVFTRNEARGVRFALGVQAGMTHVNDHSVATLPQARSEERKTAVSGASAANGLFMSSPGTTGLLFSTRGLHIL